MMSQKDQEHMVMPTYPTTHFIMIQADFAFGFFERGFDWPAHSTDTDELNDRRIRGGVAEVELDDGRILEVTAHDQPDIWSRQVAAGLAQAQKSELTNDRAFAAFLDPGQGPALFGNHSRQLINLDGTVTRMAQL